MRKAKVDHDKRTVTFLRSGFKLLDDYRPCPLCKTTVQLCKTAAMRWTYRRCVNCLYNFDKPPKS